MKCPVCKEDIKEGATVCIRCRHLIEGWELNGWGFKGWWFKIKRFLYNNVQRITLYTAIIALIKLLVRP